MDLAGLALVFVSELVLFWVKERAAGCCLLTLGASMRSFVDIRIIERLGITIRGDERR